MDKITNVNQAVDVLIKVAVLAQSSGILSLNDARLVAESVEFLLPTKQEDSVEVQEEKVEEVKKEINF